MAQGINARPGNAPKGWRRWAEEAFHPPQPWRELLGSAIRSAASGPGAGEDHVYGRPSRRSACLPGVVLPSLRRRPPRVSVIIDTSGSVSDAEPGSALLEVTAIVRAVGGRRDLVGVLSCDAAARAVGPLCRAEGISLVGGGGTDLRTGFTGALRTRPRPDVIVVLTDGQTPWPDERPPAGRWWDCSAGVTCPGRGTRTIPTTCRTHRPNGRGWSSSGSRPVRPATGRGAGRVPAGAGRRSRHVPVRASRSPSDRLSGGVYACTGPRRTG
ncbi:VWA-like domain-containing protein [Streptosporangium sp. NPDC050855]|uniref:vWA domain-containing protein n=1 Tax=Streptosporangium sp. NPDC050855 TaxID=3366194 RepID=UPI0037A73B45